MWFPWGILPYKKGWGWGGGVLVVTFRGENAILVHHSVFSLTKSTAGAFAALFRVLGLKVYNEMELVTLRGEKPFKPRPQNRILVLLRFFLSTFTTHILSF